METLSDPDVKNKGMDVLFRELGEVDAIRFLSQIRYERRDYLKIREKLFKGMSVEEIFKKAAEYDRKKNSLS